MQNSKNFFLFAILFFAFFLISQPAFAQECVDTTALATYITQWKTDSDAFTMPQLMLKIADWKSGANCTTDLCANGQQDSGETGTDCGGNCPECISSIVQYGITFTFDKGYRTGQFANGDYWVLGPVTITSMTPAFDGQHNGWQVNPSTRELVQGFDSRMQNYGATFNTSLVPALPYTALPNQSIVKSVSIQPFSQTSCRPCLQTAAVLTVLESVPLDNGANFFRPPYFGTEKPFYKINDLHSEILPTLAKTTNTPSMENVTNAFAKPQLDHFYEGWLTDFLHPADNMPYYPSWISIRNAEGTLALMTDYSQEQKKPALIAFVQYGIDLYHMALMPHPDGRTGWHFGGGEGESRKLPIAFAGVLLNHQGMKQMIESSSRCMFGENGGTYFSEKADNGNGKVLWGQYQCPYYSDKEFNYWRDIAGMGNQGSKIEIDPYGYIDGGSYPGDLYMGCCTTMPWKGNVLAALLLPGLNEIWGGENGQTLLPYIDRWVSFGTWTQPDPCAPVTGLCVGGTNDGKYCNSAGSYGKIGCIKMSDKYYVCNTYCPEDGYCNLWAGWLNATTPPADYKVKYGPDPNKPGDCIRDADASDGIGRFPLLHGTNKNTGGYASYFSYRNFTDEMWQKYR